MERPYDGNAFTGTEDGLELLTGVPLGSLVDLEKAGLLVQQPTCDGIVSLRRLRKRFGRFKARAAAAAANPGVSGPDGSGAEETGVDGTGTGETGAVGSGDAGTVRGTSGGQPAERRTEEPTKERVEGRAESVASAGGSTPAPSETDGRGLRSSVADTGRWIRLGLALAQQLEQRAAAPDVLERQRSWVAERDPTTSSGPSLAQITARLDQMPADLRFPPVLLDALLAETAGGVYVDLTNDGDFTPLAGYDGVPARSGKAAKSTSATGDETVALSEPVETPEPEGLGDQEAGESDGEAEMPERSASEAAAAMGPVPADWLIAARSWHKAKKYFSKGGKRFQEGVGFCCPCKDCQKSDGRFRGKDFCSFTWHFGRYPYNFRFSCPAEGCASTRANRNGLWDHIKDCHDPQASPEYADWLKEPVGRFQSTVRGPTRLDPFFRPSPTLPIDEPLPPKAWRAYLAGLRRPSGSANAPTVATEGGGKAEETSEGGGTSAAAAAGGAVLLAAATGGSGCGERRSKKEKASKRIRGPETEGDGASSSKKRKPGGDDGDFNPDTDDEN